MYERILVAIEGGEATRPTLEMACVLADKYESKLGIVYVTKPEEVSDSLIREAEIEGILRTPEYSGTLDRFAYYKAATRADEIERAKAVSYLAGEIAAGVVSEAESYSRKKNVKAVKTFVRSGDVADAILEVAAEAHADLIVMGHTRRSMVGDLIHRSVAEAVDKKADCPCLVLSH